MKQLLILMLLLLLEGYILIFLDTDIPDKIIISSMMLSVFSTSMIKEKTNPMRRISKERTVLSDSERQAILDRNKDDPEYARIYIEALEAPSI